MMRVFWHLLTRLIGLVNVKLQHSQAGGFKNKHEVTKNTSLTVLPVHTYNTQERQHAQQLQRPIYKYRISFLRQLSYQEKPMHYEVGILTHGI